MEKVLRVEGMTCGHCVSTVKGALDELNVKSEVRLADQTVSIDFDEQKVSLVQIKESIEENGYEVSE